MVSYVYNKLNERKGEQEMRTDKIILKIKANEGYNADQVAERNSLMTVGELKDLLEGFDDSDEIVIQDLNNDYGASFGSIIALDIND